MSHVDRSRARCAVNIVILSICVPLCRFVLVSIRRSKARCPAVWTYDKARVDRSKARRVAKFVIISMCVLCGCFVRVCKRRSRSTRKWCGEFILGTCGPLQGTLRCQVRYSWYVCVLFGCFVRGLMRRSRARGIAVWNHYRARVDALQGMLRCQVCYSWCVCVCVCPLWLFCAGPHAPLQGTRYCCVE